MRAEGINSEKIGNKQKNICNTTERLRDSALLDFFKDMDFISCSKDIKYFRTEAVFKPPAATEVF